MCSADFIPVRPTTCSSAWLVPNLPVPRWRLFSSKMSAMSAIKALWIVYDRNVPFVEELDKEFLMLSRAFNQSSAMLTTMRKNQENIISQIKTLKNIVPVNDEEDQSNRVQIRDFMEEIEALEKKMHTTRKELLVMNKKLGDYNTLDCNLNQMLKEQQLLKVAICSIEEAYMRQGMLQGEFWALLHSD